jgi:hypothetical protein
MRYNPLEKPLMQHMTALHGNNQNALVCVEHSCANKPPDLERSPGPHPLKEEPDQNAWNCFRNHLDREGFCGLPGHS